MIIKLQCAVKGHTSHSILYNASEWLKAEDYENLASEWKVPTTFIYGVQDWMNYQGAQEARKQMKVPCEIFRVPQAGHFVFLENPDGFHSAMLYACRRFLSPHPDDEPFPEGLQSA
ncbi:hypothetical protein QQP08_022713 [Theobroma cacao]|nr:hypothetical protein QQP08_022713 [Theobroma cacao]